MKKVIKSKNIKELEIFYKSNPTTTWEEFKDLEPKIYKKVVEQIKKDQGGLCCYCEIDFKDHKGTRDDFRVEHFHPKSDESENWNLKWSNLLGCCLGGSDKYVLQEKRFIKEKSHRHSDILKDDNIWDDEILNPLDIPAFPLIWKVDLYGVMLVDEDNCNLANIDIQKAKNCLDEKKLNLNSPYLVKWRKSVIDNLRDELKNLLISVADIGEAMKILANIHLSKSTNDEYFKFFTTIRSYLGQEAEQYLQSIEYDG